MVLCKKEKLVEVIPPSEAEKFKYRWIVLFCSFFVRVFIFGSVMSVGVLYVEWLDDFKLGHGDTALVGSIATGSVLLMGPISGALLDHYSCRQVVMSSGLVMSTGFVVSSFANGIPYLCFTFGIISGCAGGVANLASIVSLTQYFDHQRPLAMGVGSSGVGIGIFMFGLLQKSFIAEYTWRGSLLLVGGILFHVVICGMLMVSPDQLRYNRFLWNWKDRPSHKPDAKLEESCSCQEVELEREDNSAREIFENAREMLTRNCEDEGTRDYNHSLRKRSLCQKIFAKMRITQEILDLLKNRVFLILFVSDFFSWMVQFVPYVHLPERAVMLGIENGAVLISIMGLSSGFGKILFGALCTFFSLSPLKVFIVAQTLMGISTVLSTVCLSLWAFCLFAVSFGFLSGSYSLMMVIPAKLLGEKTFPLAYGFMLAGEGIGVYLGPPLVGWISDATQSYNSSFFLAGFLLIASALVLFLHPLLLILKRRQRKTNNTRA